MDNHRFRENISNKELGRFFRQLNNTPNKRYSNADYTRLRSQYLVTLDKNKDEQRVKRNENRRNQRQADKFFAALRNAGEAMYELRVPKRENRLKKESTFILHLSFKGTYHKTFYDNILGKRYQVDEVVFWKETTNPSTSSDPTGYIKKYLETVVGDDGYKIIELLSYSVEYMNIKKLESNKKHRIKQTMKRSFVLRNDWLKFSGGIAEYAYEETDGTCVYNQLNKFLLEPPTGRPTQFINKQRTSEDSLLNFFREFAFHKQDDYPEFDMSSGVSTEMIAALCKETKRNMYAYDDENKVFHSVTTNSSQNYCPIIFYKLHGHCYIIDDPAVMRSVAESNKKLGAKIISTTIDDKKSEKDTRTVYHIKSFDIQQAKTLEEGVYLIDSQSNLDAEIIEFIKYHKFVPQTKTVNSNITQIRFQQGFINLPKKENRKWVSICIDVTHKESYNYEQIKRVADKNKIDYSNGGIGSLIVTILENEKRSCREFLTDLERKKFCDSNKNKCNVCDLSCEHLEIDHITPLASGGANDMFNLQCLCRDCHKVKTTEEKELGVYKIKDPEGSIFNKIVLDNVVNTNEFKTWQFVEKVPITAQVNLSVKIFKTDMIKCRRNITYNSKYNFPVFSVMDNVTAFSGKIQCGMYYVETLCTFLFRGNGWYSEPLIEYALDQKLITLSDIKAELIPSSTLDKKYFKKPIDTLLTKFAEVPELQKLSVNSMVGLLGRTKHSSSHTKFTLCPYEASTWWGDKKAKSDVFIRTIKLSEEDEELTNLYEGIFSETVQIESTKYPLYKQILEMEAVELHKLESLIVNEGGVVLDRNTDAIRYANHCEIGLDQYYWDEAKTVIKYQKEEPKPLSYEVLPRMCRDKNLDMTLFNLPWSTSYDYEISAEEEAKRIVESNVSYHIDGRAGTGKSYLVNKIIAELKEQGKNFMAFAPTNVAAENIGGKTMDSVFHQYQSSKMKLFNIMETVDYIFIDEVSMMKKMFYELFTLIMRSFPNIRFIIAGDFGQLPPVKDTWAGDYENSAAMNLLCQGNRVKLTKCRRADDKLFKLCASVGSIITAEFKPTEKTYLNIAYRHITRKKINKECMERFIQEHKCETINLEWDKFNPKTQNVKLAKGMNIVAHTTNKKLRINNSENFIIDDVNKESMTFKSETKSIKINTKDFHKFFYIGFCSTVHASQGKTFHDKYTIYDWFMFCDKAKYVALSRGTNYNNIQIA